METVGNVLTVRMAPKKLTRLFAVIIAFIYACIFSSAFNSNLAFATTSSSKRTIPFERLEHGQYIIGVTVNDTESLRFMVDTAASRSSIFNKTSERLGLENNAKERYVNGITSASFRPSTTVKSLAFARQKFSNHDLIVLEDWRNIQTDERIDGIVGMDVLDGLVLAFKHKSSTVKISKPSKKKRLRYRNWEQIQLIDNPYPGQKYGLTFTFTQLGDLHIPTLLDTGANFTAINWLSVKGTKIAKERRRLREEWIVQGSIDSFKPRMRFRFDKVKVGGLKRKQYEFLLMDFENFPINNHGKYPLVIVGIDLFAGQDFVLDFAQGNLYIKPMRKKDRVTLEYMPSRINTRR